MLRVYGDGDVLRRCGEGGMEVDVLREGVMRK